MLRLIALAIIGILAELTVTFAVRHAPTAFALTVQVMAIVGGSTTFLYLVCDLLIPPPDPLPWKNNPMVGIAICAFGIFIAAIAQMSYYHLG